jgi:signal transduction histidine kinase
MLATFQSIGRATLIVIGVWAGLVTVASIAWPERSLQHGAVQLAFAVVAVGASLVVARRRSHLEIENLRSRRALLDAADAERHRLERDIHDGAQQLLVAIGVKAGLARSLVERDSARVGEILDQVCVDAQAALEGLRDLTRGADPPVLVDEGLAAALVARAATAPVRVTIDADGVERLPRPIEVAAYYCCAEAIQNAVKHATASWIRVAVWRRSRELRVQVIDDGVGFDPAIARRGVGMHSMRERIGSLGGTVEVRSAPGLGTTITATIPIAQG